MTVYIGSAAFVAQLQRERDELLAENRRLLKELKALQGFSNRLAEIMMPWCEECQCYHHETSEHIEKLGKLFDWDAILKGKD